MSSDNYYVVIQTKPDEWAAVMGFDSDDEPAKVTERCPRFERMADAVLFAATEYAEYGIRAIVPLAQSASALGVDDV